MAIEITHVRFDGTVHAPEVIVAYKWVNRDSGKNGWSDKPTLVEWVSKGNHAYVANGTQQVKVDVVRPAGRNPYLRAVADGTPTNNLENLPLF